MLVHDGKPLWMRSVKLGAARLAERFLLDDPPTRAQLGKLEAYLERTIGPLMRKAKRAGVVRAIGTSGTINTLVAMARSSRGEELGRLHGAIASAGEISDLSRDLVEANAALRVDLPGMDAKRVDLMPAAATLVNFILKKSGAPELVACTWALREGVLLGLAQQDRFALRRRRAPPLGWRARHSIRRRQRPRQTSGEARAQAVRRHRARFGPAQILARTP